MKIEDHLKGGFRSPGFLEIPVNAQKTPDNTDKLKGSVKEAIGKLIGDGKVEAEGKAQQKLTKSDTKPKPKSNS